MNEACRSIAFVVSALLFACSRPAPDPPPPAASADLVAAAPGALGARAASAVEAPEEPAEPAGPTRSPDAAPEEEPGEGEEKAPPHFDDARRDAGAIPL
jgi:hypothetical protein